jgi:hypothetical protein
MAKTKKYYGFFVSTVYIFVLLSVICIAIGCSSKKDKINNGKSSPAKNNVNSPSAHRDTDKKTHKSESSTLPILPSPEANQAANTPQIIKEVNTAKINEPCEAKISIDALLKEFKRTNDSERKIELLNSLSAMASDQDPCVIRVAQKAVADKDANVALAAVGLLQGYNSPEVLPAISEAMTHKNEDVRQTAVNLLLDINDPQTGNLLVSALSDKSEDIRNSSLDITKYKDKQTQYMVLEKAISSPYDDVKDNSVFMLEYLGGHGAVNILIEAMRNKDAEFHEKVGDALNMLLNQEFKSYNEAKTWWDKNQSKYDEDLTLIEDQQDTKSN